MSDYTKIPSTAQAQPKPFKAEVSEEKLQQFKQLLKYSHVAPDVWENQQKDRRFGVTRDWIVAAKKEWETNYDWRAREKHINSFPQYTLPIDDDDGNKYEIHFAALFSEKEDAIPIAFYHGWPGSFLEFLPMLEVIKKQYSANDLPYHIIVPSLPGYTYSTGPPATKDLNTKIAAGMMNKLMIALGFGSSGYIAQGGDIGSAIARQSAINSPECKALHLNMNLMTPPDDASSLPVSATEKDAQKHRSFRHSGSAYAQEHGTRTATIGFVLSSSPLALLAWIGEKFLEWTDEDPALETILDGVTLYYLTDTISRCLYPYRQGFGEKRDPELSKPKSKFYHTGSKPLGYTWLPYELVPTPRSWTEQATDNLVSYKEHDAGGHFAAMERPEVLWGDVEEFVKKAWK